MNEWIIMVFVNGFPGHFFVFSERTLCRIEGGGLIFGEGAVNIVLDLGRTEGIVGK